jgi:hypothetical protein
LAEDPPRAIDRSSLSEDQQIVDDLTVDLRARQIADDDPCPAVGGPGEGGSLASVQPTEKANLDGERRRRGCEKLRPLWIGLRPVRLVFGHVSAVSARTSILTDYRGAGLPKVLRVDAPAGVVDAQPLQDLLHRWVPADEPGGAGPEVAATRRLGRLFDGLVRTVTGNALIGHVDRRMAGIRTSSRFR